MDYNEVDRNVLVFEGVHKAACWSGGSPVPRARRVRAFAKKINHEENEQHQDQHDQNGAEPVPVNHKSLLWRPRQPRQ